MSEIPFRIYEPSECGGDGYPLAWHSLDHDTLLDWSSSIGESHYPPGAVMGVKHLVRVEAGHRCVRCLHPYRNGTHGRGQWSPCDERCSHRGPLRWTDGTPIPGGAGADAALIGASRFGAHGGGVEAEWRILTVHHLRLGDDAKRDLRWWNLLALCQRCHLYIQGTVVLERVYPWPHEEWFKPYAAGWYAHSYLGEDLSRAEVMARLDELLALELAA